MIIESVEHGSLIWPTIKENGVTKTNKYEELSATEKIQVDYDLNATNITLQGLPSDVYSLVNHYKVAKDLWERVQLLMQGIDGNNSGQQRVDKCFNYQGEGHMARQCPKLKRKRDATWFMDKVLLVEAQGSGKVINEEELESYQKKVNLTKPNTFSDGTLNDVRIRLHDIAKGIRMEYMPKRKWSGLDKGRAQVMV
nr:hypothetical protein [Tanacetum cinerariifolium]